MKLYNTLGRQLQEFKPIKAGQVSFYSCGPTVYDYQHIGNYSGYVYWDILVRLLSYEGNDVKRVMNITDVGHLVSNQDEGEDKLEAGAKREGKSATQIAGHYTKDFLESMDKLGLIKPTYAKATDYIPQQVEMIKVLVDKGFAYKTEQAIYFDVSKLNDYGKLTGQRLEDKEIGVRSEVVVDKDKHHAQDFALWFFTVGRFSSHELHWPSPWGEGFPGWHIECSAIVHTLLGDPIDIHAGGVDHIGTHHTNEIAQTEAAYDHDLAKFWIHNNHMMVDGKKISKSLGNGFTLIDLDAKGYSPMDFKMLVLQSHYRNQSNFTWEALKDSQIFLKKIYAWADLRFQPNSDKNNKVGQTYEPALSNMLAAISDDLATPQALGWLSGLVSQAEAHGADIDKLSPTIQRLDGLLGFDLSNRLDITDEQKKIIAEREEARKLEDWNKSDNLRNRLAEQGIGLRDTEQGAIWFRL